MPRAVDIRLRPVASRHNAVIKAMRRALVHGELTEDGLCAIESMKLIEEAIRSGLRFQAIIFSESGSARAGRLLPQLRATVDAIVVPDDIFRSAVETESPQGLAALVHPRKSSLDEMLQAKNPLLVITQGLQDPGNLGTTLRSAEAFGATGVILGEGTVSLFNPKALRASAGSAFRLPAIASKFEEVVHTLREGEVRLIGTTSHRGKPIHQAEWSKPCAVLIGNEGAGLSARVLAQMDELVTVPHAGSVESLNAGVAASVILYEAARQRQLQ